jgi:zinc protease
LRGAARPEPAIALAAEESGFRAVLHNEPRDGVQMELIALRAKDAAPDSEAVRLHALRLDLARNMIGRRLQRLTETRGDTIAAYSLRHNLIAGRFEAESAVVGGNAKEWTTLLGIIEQEVRRAAEQGFDASELAAAMDNERVTLRQSAEQTPTLPSSALAEAIAEFVEEGRVFAMPADRLAVGLANLDATTAADCQAAWRAEWERGSRRLFVTASPKWLKVAPKKIVAAYEQSRTTPVAAAAALADVKFAYEDFGPPGVVTQRQRVDDLDVWQVRFANGVRLNLKRTEFQRGRVHFRLRFGSGRASEPRDHPGLGLWAGGLLVGGLSKHTEEEMRQAMRGHPVTLSMHTDDATCSLQGTTQGDDLRRFIQVATAYLVDPAWRAEDEPQVRRLVASIYSNMQLTPEIVVQTWIMPFLGGGEGRLGLPPREIVEKQSFAALAAWLKPMLESSPIEATLVGDFDVDAAVAEVAKTLGALPPRAEPTLAATNWQLKFPQPPETRRYIYPAVAGRPTTLLLDWPVHETLAAVEQRRLRLLATILEDRLRVQIREEKGATYSPGASFIYSEAYPGLAALRCRLDVGAKALKKIGEQVVAIACDLGKSGVTGEELGRAQAQAVAGVRQQLSKNEYWLDALDDSQTRPGRIDELRTFEQAYASATKADLDSLAKRYLTEKNLFRFIIEPKTVK